MAMNARPMRDEADRARMLDMARLCPTENVHVIDLPYRFSSGALDSAENVALWEEGDTLLGWAVLQSPFWTLDYALHPDAPAGLHAEILAWANGRAGQLRDSPGGRPSWFVPVLERQAEQRRVLMAAGYSDQSAAEEPWSKVLFRRDGQEPVPRVAMRPGFAVRPLAGVGEVAAYVTLHRAVFGTANMTEAWRLATLSAPGHRPEFDLLATNPAGEPVGFAVAWWWDGPGGAVAQVEPFGVRADARPYGVAWALMFELLRRLAEVGATEVRVETDRQRDAAFAFYSACGFQIVENVLVYRRDTANL